MKKAINLFLLLSFFISAQAQFVDWEDYTPLEASLKTTNYAPNGRDFSPHGTIRVMIIYAGFYDPVAYDDAENLNQWSPYDQLERHTNVPNYIYNEDYPIFFTDADQLNDPAYSNVFNLTRFYDDASHGDFIMLGDCFRDPDPNSSTYGEPIRINVDPSTVGSSWGTCNKKVLEKIRDEYGTYWDNIWAPYDNRDNNPNYQFDNSVVNADGTPVTGDGKVDYVIIHWRYDKGWENQPKAGMQNWSGSGGGITSLASLSYSNYSVSEGFTSTKGGFSQENVVMFFPHEFAHEVYGCPHVMGANTTRGEKLYFPIVGWGMMSASSHLMVGTNAWEAYMLGWNDLEVGGFNTKIDSPNDLNTSASYRLYDYALTGDAIRVKIPFSEDYLWIENHQKKTNWEFKAWEGKNPSYAVSSNLIPDFEKGVYMYVEDIEEDINSYSVSAGNYDLLNEIKVLNAVGNWDYQRSEYPKLDPNNNNYS